MQVKVLQFVQKRTVSKYNDKCNCWRATWVRQRRLRVATLTVRAQSRGRVEVWTECNTDKRSKKQVVTNKKSRQPDFKALKSRAVVRENPNHIRLISTWRSHKFDHETSEFIQFFFFPFPPWREKELGHMSHAAQIQAMIMLSKHIISWTSHPHQLPVLIMTVSFISSTSKLQRNHEKSLCCVAAVG